MTALPVGSHARYTARILAKHPLAAAAAVLSIGLGVGFNVGTYAVLRHVLFDSPLTAGTSDRFVRVDPSLSFPDFEDLRRVQLPVDLAAMQMGMLTWQSGDTPRTISAHIVSDNFFQILGVKPVLGRTFDSADADATKAVVTFSFWERNLGSDPAAVGRLLEFNGWPYTLVGVLPKEFAANPMIGGVVFVPISPHASVGLESRSAGQFDLIARLREGVDRDQATAALRLAVSRLEGRAPDAAAMLARSVRTTSIDAFSLLRAGSAGRIVLAAAATFYALMALVLVIACANVSGLLLMRADERRREIAVRIALGATPRRLACQAFVESLSIAVCGCTAGFLLWTVTARLLRSGIAAAGSVDVAALWTPLPVGYGMLLLGAITFGCGLASAAHIARLSRADGLTVRAGGGSPRRFTIQRALVAVQIAVCFVLLVADAFFLANLVALRTVDAGFDAAHVFAANVRVPTAATPRDQLAIRTAIATEPGVEAVTWGSPIGLPFTERLQTNERESIGISTDIRPVGPRFFETLRIPIVHGRDLVDSEVYGHDRKSVAVNETFVRRYLSSADPIGRRFLRPANHDSGRPQQVLEIVGVARDSMARTIGESRVPVVYVAEPSRSFTIRLAQADAAAAPSLQDRLRRFEPPGSVVTVVPLANDIAAALQPVQIATVVLSILAIIGLVLATTGLYAVVNYVVTQRTVELGIRTALGATRRQVMAIVLADGMPLVALGCVFGALVSWLASRVVQKLIVGQPIVGLGIFGAVTCTLLMIAAAAMLQPAHTAGGADPIKALRYE